MAPLLPPPPYTWLTTTSGLAAAAGGARPTRPDSARLPATAIGRTGRRTRDSSSARDDRLCLPLHRCLPERCDMSSPRADGGYGPGVASPFVELEIDTPAGERTVKVTNPDKTYFSGLPEGRGRKLDLVEYYLAVGDGIVRALRERPTVLKRHPGGAETPAIYQKRVPDNRPPWMETVTVQFPSGRSADRAVPGRRRARRVGGQQRLPRLPPVAVPPGRRGEPRRAADRPRPDAGHRLGGRAGGRAGGPGALRRARLHRVPQDQRQQGHPRLPADPAGLDVHPGAARRARRRPRGGAAPPGPGHRQVVEGGARRAGVPGLQPDGPRPDDRLRVQRPRPPAGDGRAPR